MTAQRPKPGDFCHDIYEIKFEAFQRQHLSEILLFYGVLTEAELIIICEVSKNTRRLQEKNPLLCVLLDAHADAFLSAATE